MLGRRGQSWGWDRALLPPGTSLPPRGALSSTARILSGWQRRYGFCRRDLQMPTYANLGGDSGVRSYEIGSDRIQVTFSDGSIYEYTHASAGRHNVEHMTMLARAGRGLNSFISSTPQVKKGYSRRVR